MSEPGPRVAAWLGTIGDLLRERLYEMPDGVILDQLEKTFSVTAVSHHCSDHQGRETVVAHPHDVLQPIADQMEAWNRGEMRGCHALVSWYSITGDPRPTTNGRVPTALVPLRRRLLVEQPLRPFQLDQQLSIIYRLQGASYNTYVLGRGSTDFGDEDIVVARHIQRALIGLDRQITLVKNLSGWEGTAIEAGLTGREFAVLGLIAAGHPTRIVGRRLGCSPRTVNKHLERIYRKLGVRDRLNAVRIARLWGMT